MVNKMKADEFVIVVDDNDQPIGLEEKMKAHREGKQHRAFSVFIFRENLNIPGNIELLLQQRQWDKYHCGGLWTNTCCSHPRVQEDIITAANRRLYEEMGIKCHLNAVGRFHYIAKLENGLIENEVDHVLIGNYQEDTILFNSEEVANCRWVNLFDLENEYQTNPQLFTPWFLEAYLVAKKHIPTLFG